jgi:hypothetical protein
MNDFAQFAQALRDLAFAALASSLVWCLFH